MGSMKYGVWCLLSLLGQGSVSAQMAADLTGMASGLHNAFLENRGQWPEEVRFAAWRRGWAVAIERNALSFTCEAGGADGSGRIPLRWLFEGSNPDVRPEGQGKRPAAFRFFQKMPSSGLTLWDLGDAFQMLGRMEEAFAAYLRALELNGDVGGRLFRAVKDVMDRQHLPDSDEAKVRLLAAIEAGLVSKDPDPDLAWLLGALLPKTLGNVEMRGKIFGSGLEKFGTLFLDALADSLSKPAGEGLGGEALAALQGSEPRRVAYFEGRLLQQSGNHARAFDRFRSILEAGNAEAGPILRYAECARAVGDFAGAAAILRTASLKSSPYEREILDLWLAIELADLKRGPEEVLAEFPWIEGEDHRWLLERLIAKETVRIDCGSEKDFHAPDGSIWSRDRFRRGSRYIPGGANVTLWGYAVGKTNLAPLYRSQRWFAPRCGQTPSYAIPLPPGRWRVRLHFSEMFYCRPAVRVFDVVIEGQKVLESYDPFKSAGFATAEVKEFEVEVTDGLLEVFFPQPGRDPLVAPSPSFGPSIAALEVERIE